MRIIDDKTTTAEPSAKDMFEELGYKLSENSNDFIIYVHKELGAIMFGMRYRDVLVGNTQGMARVIKPKEIRAINKMMEELNWNEY